MQDTGGTQNQNIERTLVNHTVIYWELSEMRKKETYLNSVIQRYI